MNRRSFLGAGAAGILAGSGSFSQVSLWGLLLRTEGNGSGSGG